MRLENWIQRAVAGGLAAACCLWGGRGQACSGYEDSVPLSARVPADQRCQTCHSTGVERNAFGNDWCSLCYGGCGTHICPTPTTPTIAPDSWSVCNRKHLGLELPELGIYDSDGDGIGNDQEFRDGTSPGALTPFNECSADPCDDRAVDCTDPNPMLRGDFQCRCPAGLEGDGRTAGSGCTDVDECDSDPPRCADERSQCVNTEGGFECPCDDGFVGSGRVENGCTMQNFCDDNPCSEYSICYPRQGGFDCRACAPGFAGDPLTCAACPPGYAGDGVGAAGCSDVNECTASPSECSASVNCINSTGGRTCPSCPPGFTGNAVGVNGCVKDVCADCSPYANCDPQRNPPCLCNDGFAGADGHVCTDIDECAREDQHGCGANSTCHNVLGSYLCACNAGFAAQGNECVPARCATWGQSCGEQGACDDGGGTRLPQCVCAPGLSGTYPACVGSKSLTLGAPDPGSAPPAENFAFAARSSGCGLAAPTSGLPASLPIALLVGLGAWRRRAGSRRNASVPVAALCLLWALLSCGDSPPDTIIGSATPPEGGSGGRPQTSLAGAGGSMAGGGRSGADGSGDDGTGTDNGGGSAGGDATEPSGGSSGAAPVVAGAAPGTFTCRHSRECDADRWCNPASTACELRNTGEGLTFRGQIFGLIQSIGCPGCHSPGERGEVNTSGSGVTLLLHDMQRGYLSLVAGGVKCQAGAERICLDDPASSRLIRQVKAGESSSPESVAFNSWSEPKLQTLLRWIASGAPRDTLCGNFERDSGEACDEGPTPATRCPYGVASCTLCTTNCQTLPSGAGPACGDGIVDAAHEKCDPASALPSELGPYGNAVCGSDCTFQPR